MAFSIHICLFTPGAMLLEMELAPLLENEGAYCCNWTTCRYTKSRIADSQISLAADVSSFCMLLKNSERSVTYFLVLMHILPICLECIVCEVGNTGVVLLCLLRV